MDGIRVTEYESPRCSGSWEVADDGGAAMTLDQAVAWMHQVKGRFYQTPTRFDRPSAWVAVVRVPAAGTRPSKLIIALGGSLLEAADAAEEQWQTLWDDLSTLH